MKWGETHSVVPGSLQTHRLSSPWNSPGHNIRVDSHSLLQGTFPTQGSKPGLPHCRRILYQLSDKRGWLFSLYINTVILLYTTLPLRFSYKKINILIISFQFSHVQLYVAPWTAARQVTPSITNSRSQLKLMSSRWYHPTISSTVVPFSSCLQSFQASGSFLISGLFASHQVAKGLEFQLQHQSFQWIFRTDSL